VTLDGSDAAALVEAIAARRDRAAFSRLFELFAPRVKGQLMARGASAATADELTQEVMLSVWRKAAQFDRAKGLVSTWLFVIARNAFLSHHRRHRWPEPDALADATAAAPTPDALLLSAEGHHHLREALGALPTEQRQAIDGAYYRGRTLSELAEEQGLPLGTVKTRVRLALARLREAVGANPPAFAGNPINRKVGS
jgi:RNA polymerase sigma-70 factor, ECF subfamily